MAKQLLPEAEQYAKQNNLRQIWRKFVRVMACVVVFCTTYALILPAITMEKDLICGMEEHVHAENCYAQVTTVQRRELTCTYESLGVHVHGAECADAEGNLTCGRSDYVLHAHDDSCTDACTLPEISGHVHADGCYQAVTAEPELVCGLEETEGHAHGESCYDAGGALVCELAEAEGHAHSDACWQTPAAEPELVCGRAEAILHSHTEACYDAEDVLTCALPVLEQHIHGETCFTVTVEAADTQSLTCGLEESETHTHTDLCYGTWELVCEMAEHAHTDKCYPAADAMAETVPGETDPATGLTESEQAAVDHVISLIEVMPSADEIDAKIAEFEAAEDYEGEEAWLTETYQQVAYVYSQYSALTEAQKAQVTNADKLLELEYIWGVTTLGVSSGSHTVYQINSYNDSTSDDTVMVYGGTVAEKVKYQFLWWYAIKVEKDTNGDLRVVEILQPGNDSIKSNYRANDTGFVLLIYYTNPAGMDVVVGDYVTVNFTLPSNGVGAYKSAGYGTISFSTPSTNIISDPLTIVESANTSDFVKLNLYDYHGTKYTTGFHNINQRYNGNKEYPGYQWNGGAYPYRYRADGYSKYGWIANRNLVDCIDFGNSLITDYALTASPYVPDQGTLYSSPWYSGNITAGKIGIASSSGANGLINAIVYGNGLGNTDRPAGLTSSFGNAVTLNANSDGYPSLVKTASTTYGQSLEYLFSGTHPGKYADQRNEKNIDGLFQYDPVSGAYYYDSRENHAQYDDVNDRFVLYEQVLTPNFILYPFGNFMPLDDITDRATQVSAMNYQGGVATYFQTIINRLLADSNLDNSEIQLIRMLYSYRYSWENWTDLSSAATHTRKWFDITAADALNDYFNNSSEFASEKWNFDSSTQKTSSGRTMSQLMDKVYNMAFDVESNFFFGMDMQMNFYQPKGGMTGTDQNGDGTFDYPMEFYFAGDDDVWVYIDGILFLDLTGIHRHVGGKIDFVNGKVYYYAMDSYVDGAVTSTSYLSAPKTFKEILEAAGADPSQYLKKDANGNYTTFKDYSVHEFKFYYMERGSGSSVCRINFNFPLLRQNTLSVEKELTADDDIKALGNPDFQFQVLDVDANGNKTNESFFKKFDSAGGQWAYSLYDADGSVIQEVKVTEKNPDGTVKELTVYNAAGLVVRTETEDANGKAVITNYPENGEVLTIDENGIFTLKAGQRAEFVGISENWGKYYVRELIDPAIVAQYGDITVDGEASSHVDNITVGTETFKGYDSPVMDMSNGSTRFRFNNQIASAKLSDLSIQKVLDAPYSGDTDKTFRFAVTLDGQPLPAGTTYTVDSATKTVVIENGVSYVELKGGEKAIISDILAGTTFEVKETATSAEGYVVSYTVNGTAQEASATGTIGLEQTVAVVVKNSERGTAVQIPVTKGYYRYGTVDRQSLFKLVRVKDATGMETMGEPTTASLTVKDVIVTNDALFTLKYLEKDVDFTGGDTQVYYYRLTENNTQLPGSTLPNYQVFVYEVTVTKTADNMTSAITGMWSGTADAEGTPTGNLTKLDQGSTATFMNTIFGPLTVTKKVDGSDAYKQQEFEFEIIINTLSNDNDSAGGAPLPDTLPAVITNSDDPDNPKATAVELTSPEGSETRKSIKVKLSHNESITINNIPYNATWSVTELNVPEDVEVSYEIYRGSEIVASASSDKPVGKILVGGNNVAKVVFTNKQVYVLPETGGAGTTCYTMAGLMLMLCSAAYLLYRFKKRGREVV